MKRALTRAALTVALLVGGTAGLPGISAEHPATHLRTVAAEDASRGEWRWEQCRFARLDGQPGFTTTEVRRTLECARRIWPGNLDLGLRIVGCESGFVATAQNPDSSAGGVWQAIDSTWSSWKTRFAALIDRWRLRTEKLNGRVNAVLGWRVFSADGTGPWRVSQWCWG